jgi:hypothetical protein
MPYTPDEIMRLAEEGYMGGLKPEKGVFFDDRGACALGSACYTLTGARIVDAWEAADVLGRTCFWTCGVARGFDNYPMEDNPFLKTLSPSELADYRAGYEWGQAAREKFLENVPEEKTVEAVARV